MTLAEGITRVLNRVGLSDTTTEFKDRARDYINQILAETVPSPSWWWLDRTTTFATVASTRVYSPVSGNVTSWYSFVDETNNRPLTIVGPDEYDLSDVDRSQTGSVDRVFIGGQDATTGHPTVELWRTPDSVETIRVRYKADIDEWTSSDDLTDFLALRIPRIMESVLIYGASSLYMEENGDDSGGAREAGNFQRALQQAKKQNVEMQGNRKYIPLPADQIEDGLITIGTDIVV
jgi:hypothetical protein